MSSADAVAEQVALPLPTLAAGSPRMVSSRHRARDYALRRALFLADFVGLWLALILALAITANGDSPVVESLWLLPTLPAWALLFRAYGLYERPLRRFEPTHLDDISSLFHALVVGTLGLWLFYRLMPVPKLDFLEVLGFGLLSMPLIAGLRVLVRILNLRHQGPERVLALAPLEDVMVLNRKLTNHPEYEMALVGAVAGDIDAQAELGLPLGADLESVDDLIASGRVDHLIVRLDANFLSQVRVRELMYTCHQSGVRFGFFPGERALLLPGTELNHIEGVGILTSNPPVFSRTSGLLKRSLDLTVSALLLVLLAPSMALIAGAIALDSEGEILFKQIRVGKDGKRFRLVKFRTMSPDADSRVAELMAHSTDPDWLILDEDPRVTRVGRFLRKTSLDELPQLWNVLKGEMSLVGPRPLPECDDEAVKGWGRHRLDLVPGVTGYWQVLGRNSIPFREMVEVDYAYVSSWSLIQDLKLLARTLPVVITRRGAN